VSAAIHEACHAAMALLDERPLLGIHVRADGRGMTLAQPARTRHDRIRSHLAGVIGERLAHLDAGWGTALDGSRTDIDRVRQMRPTRSEVVQAVSSAAYVLSSRWDAVTRIAGALRRRRLDGAEAARIWASTPATAPHHTWALRHFAELVDAVCPEQRTDSEERMDRSELRPACWVAPGERAVDVCPAADAREKLDLARADVGFEIQLQAMAAGFAAESAHPMGVTSAEANAAYRRAYFAIIDAEVAKTAQGRAVLAAADQTACECEHDDDPADRPTAWVQNNDSRATNMNNDTDNEMDALARRSATASDSFGPRTRRDDNPRLTGDPDPQDLAHRSVGGNDAPNSAKRSRKAINNAGPYVTPEDCTCPHFPEADEQHAEDCPLFVDPSGGPRVVAPTTSAIKKSLRGDRIDDPEAEAQEALAARSYMASAQFGRPTEDHEDVAVDSEDEATAQAQSLARSSAMFARPNPWSRK